MKEAVVFVLDANESMDAVYDEEQGTTRFDCAKQVVQDMISDLMIRSKQNEVGVVVLKTAKTLHHFFEDGIDDDNDGEIPFPNLTELGGDGESCTIGRPTPEILRRIATLHVTPGSQDLRGDFCDGIIVAADALFRRTQKKKFERRIILITDAEHRVMVDHKQLLVVLDSLRDMECRLEVIGLDFEQQAEYAKAASADTAKIKQEERGEGKDSEMSTVAHDSDGSESATDVSTNGEDKLGDEEGESDEEDVDNEEIRLMVKQQNERLLIGLTEKTGGFVMAAKELQSILKRVLGKKISKSVRKKFSLKIAPGLEIEARFSLLLSRASSPRLTKRAAQEDENGNIRTDSFGEEITTNFQTILSHWDPESEEQEILETARGYRYGSDAIPMGDFDLSGLTKISPVQMTLLGYLPVSRVPPELRIGPPYAVSGADSRRACAAVAALAQTLRRTNQVGIATMVKTKNHDPILVGVFPLEEGDRPIHLVFLQLPWQGDVPVRPLPNFEPSKDPSKQTVCDDLIESLLIPDDALNYTQIPNPAIRSFHQTVIQRVLDPKCPVVASRPSESDSMETPRETLERAKPALTAFRKAFPLSKVKNSDTERKSKRKRGPLSYRDFVEDEDD